MRTAITAAVALLAAASLVLAGCGGGGTDEDLRPAPVARCQANPNACK